MRQKSLFPLYTISIVPDIRYWWCWGIRLFPLFSVKVYRPQDSPLLSFSVPSARFPQVLTLKELLDRVIPPHFPFFFLLLEDGCVFHLSPTFPSLIPLEFHHHPSQSVSKITPPSPFGDRAASLLSSGFRSPHPLRNHTTLSHYRIFLFDVF